MRLYAILFGFVVLSANALANTNHSEEGPVDEVDRLFVAMQADQMTSQMWVQMEALFNQMLHDLDPLPENNAIIQKYNKELVTLLQKEMSWEKMEPEVRHIYVQNFTTEEITKLAEFYESDVGQAFVKRMPVVMQESMQMGQRMAMAAMPQLQALSARMKAELEAAKESATKSRRLFTC